MSRALRNTDLILARDFAHPTKFRYHRASDYVTNIYFYTEKKRERERERERENSVQNCPN